ncbi:saccharopine dehydrogenase family protein [Alkalimonas mucilaginosa]|uniref:Saccharopine dehydrogenase NADP-binding domain-containing protein n=1 Tax=Alkalimonas mucilaginosa TaxID=3057676 RepID=A0ABU7JAE7_9GAMM|nr:saccharopine dehydrogenase NADP-binding domain-containing protein [Alkalimonas sp. MEB004]MEE2022676.1 saccharopine dehydrogenase NADP-binding domain-containing protein [Alkalimonas sp. MEB004]
MTVTSVVILGGYGNFGKRIAENLAAIPGIKIIIAGRCAKKGGRLCQQLAAQGANATLEAAVLDIYQPEFVAKLRALSPELVIHTGGPFQGQDYRVPEACIAAGCHYIDLADDRRFVCDITALNEKACAANVLIVSGASSVPGLSSTVIDSFSNQFAQLDSIDFAIAPGNQAERGEATVRGILSYTGHPFMVFSDGNWVHQYGWMSPRRVQFGDKIGPRWLANVDIPDLELFPKRYTPVRTVRFQAGLELPLLHLGMVFMAFLAKCGLVRDWSVFTRTIFRLSTLFQKAGTDMGAMQVNLSGLDWRQQVKQIRWTLYAENGVGPYIPTISAILLAKKLIAGTLDSRGATPCLGLYTMAEFDQEAASLGIYHKTETHLG